MSTQSKDACSILIRRGADINIPAGIKMCRSRRKQFIIRSTENDMSDGQKDSEQSKHVKVCKMFIFCSLFYKKKKKNF